MGREEIVDYVLNIKGNAADKAKTLSRTLGGIGKVAGVAAAGIGVVTAATIALARETKELTDEVFGTIRALEQQSKMFDLNTETLGGLRLAALATGQELSDIIPEDLAERMFDASVGGGEMAEIFQRWGIALHTTSGELRTASDVLPEVIGALTEMESGTDAAALASILLGDNGRKMLATFESRGEFEAFVAASHDYGITAAPTAAAGSREWAAANAELMVGLDTLKGAIVEELGGEVVDAMGVATQAAYALAFAFDDILAAGEALHELRGAFIGPIPNIFAAHDAATALRTELTSVGTAWERAGIKMADFGKIGEDVAQTIDFLAQTTDGLFNVAEAAFTPGAGGKKSAPSRRSSAPQEPDDQLAAILDELRAQQPKLDRQGAALDELGPGFMAALVEGLELAAEHQRDAAREAQLAGSASALGGLLGGGSSVSGVAGSALSGMVAGPFGALLGMIPGILTQEGGVGGVALDLQQQVIDILDALPETLTQLLSADFLTALLANGVEIMARTFVLLPFEIGAAVAVGLHDLFLDLPGAIADALAGLFEKLTSPFRGKDGKFLGTALGDDPSLFGVPLPSFDVGTPRVRRTGAAVVHAGEAIFPAAMAAAMRGGGGGGSRTNVGGISIREAASPRETAIRLRRALGLRGLNESLAPIGS